MAGGEYILDWGSDGNNKFGGNCPLPPGHVPVCILLVYTEEIQGGPKT